MNEQMASLWTVVELCEEGGCHRRRVRRDEKRHLEFAVFFPTQSNESPPF